MYFHVSVQWSALAFPAVRLLTIATCSAVLVSCATAHISGVVQGGGAASAPTAILVQVTDAVPDRDAEENKSYQLAARLQSDVIHRLTRAGVTVAGMGPGAIPARDVVLRLTITRADPGNAAQRLLLGFGAGKSKLAVSAILDNQPGGQALLAFSSTSDSGRKPGLILPVGVATATGSIVHLAIGGALDLGVNARSGLDQNADRTARAIVRQLKAFYASAGWRWPV